MSSSIVSFEQAAQSIMDATIDPSRWTDAMEKLAAYSGAKGVVLLPIKGRRPGIPHTKSLDEGLDTYYREGWNRRDERARGLFLLKQKGIFVDQDFATREEIATSDYYRKFLAKYDANWSAAVGFSEPDVEWCIVFNRGDQEGYFNEKEQADIVRFGPHLAQAAALAHSVASSNATAAIEAYESVGCASFLVNMFGRVIKHNPSAEQLFGNGLELRAGHLRATDVASNELLQKLISEQTAPWIGHHPTVIVTRSAMRPLIIRAVALEGMAKSVFASAATLLLVSNANGRSSPSAVETIKAAFNLTRSESKLLAFLEKELSLSDCADHMKISVETARTHLKHIFAKTGTRRQSELLMMMFRL